MSRTRERFPRRDDDGEVIACPLLPDAHGLGIEIKKLLPRQAIGMFLQQRESMGIRRIATVGILVGMMVARFLYCLLRRLLGAHVVVPFCFEHHTRAPRVFFCPRVCEEICRH